MRRDDSILGPALGLMLGTAAIGMAPIFVRWSAVGPVSTGFWRLLLASLAIAALTPVSRKKRYAGGWVGGALLAGLAFGGDLGVWHLSVQLTSVANATLLANLAPVFLLFFAQIFLGERIRPQAWAAIGVSCIGLWLLLGSSVSLRATRGDLFGMAAALFYAAYLLVLRRIPRGAPSWRVLAVSSACGAAILLPFALAHDAFFWPRDLRGWLVLLGLAGVSQLLGQGLITRYLGRLPASLSSAILVCQSAFAAFFGWWFLGETLHPAQSAGAGLLLAGIFGVRRFGLGQRP